MDKTDKKNRFVAVQVRFVEKLKKPVSLKKLKKAENFSFTLNKTKQTISNN